MTPIEQFGGGLLIEVFFAILLYGIMTTQAYLYWFSYPEDSKLTRWTVVVVWTMETIHLGFCMHVVYTYFVLDFSNIDYVFNRFVWSVAATVLLSVLIAAVVQSFFIHRIYILSHGLKTVTAILAFLLFSRVAFGIATSILSWTLREWAVFSTEAGPRATLITGVSLAALVDLLIALSMIFWLQQGRKGILNSTTNHIVHTLMLYSVSTGALTVLVSIAILVTMLLVKDSVLFIGLVEIQCKLYSNSLFASLNARNHLNNARAQVHHEETTLAPQVQPPNRKRLTDIDFTPRATRNESTEIFSKSADEVSLKHLNNTTNA